MLDGVHIKKFNYFYPKRYQKLCGRSGMIDNVKEGFFVKIQFLSFIFFNVLNSWKLRDMDMIHVQWPIPNGLGALFIKIFNNTHYINTIHGEEVYLSKRYHTTFVLKILVRNSFKTINNSSETLKVSLKNGLKKDKLEIIPFGVDTNIFKPYKVLKNEQIIQILSIGYLIERKGFEYLIKSIKEVLKIHHNINLKIVGTGPLENQIKNQIKELELEGNIEILGNVSDEKLLDLYNSSDIFVLPSIVDSQGNTEGLGVVLLEAMACKLPVIASNIGGIPDIVHDRINGLLVPQKNIFELSNALNELIKNEELRKSLALNGYEMVKGHFSWEQIAKDYLKIYKEITEL